jgi:hypothetical protein
MRKVMMRKRKEELKSYGGWKLNTRKLDSPNNKMQKYKSLLKKEVISF